MRLLMFLLFGVLIVAIYGTISYYFDPYLNEVPWAYFFIPYSIVSILDCRSTHSLVRITNSIEGEANPLGRFFMKLFGPGLGIVLGKILAIVWFLLLLDSFSSPKSLIISVFLVTLLAVTNNYRQLYLINKEITRLVKEDIIRRIKFTPV